MPKRKRSPETSSLQALLDEQQTEVHRALKAAKGFERQRLSKRLREPSKQPNKQQRLQREVSVLKSLNLHDTARAHLIASLLKVKPVAAVIGSSDELRAGIPKPDLSDEDRAALHNITSGLCNRDPVKQAVAKAIASVCQALKLPHPQKSQRPRSYPRCDEDGLLRPGKESLLSTQAATAAHGKQASDGKDLKAEDCQLEGDAETDSESGQDASKDVDFSKYDDMLASSSEEDEDFEAEKIASGNKRRKSDSKSLSASSASSSSDDDLVKGNPQSRRKTTKANTEAKKRSVTGGQVVERPKDSTFLPSLLGGYISGSESASDIEEAKPKKRRGQRARQAIWEKKYGASARHLQTKAQHGGRDAGWDMKRGAVGEEDRGPTKFQVKKRDAFQNRGRSSDRRHPESAAGQATSKPAPRDDQGTLHPSWEAKKKAKDSQKAVAFSGQKIVFT